MCRNKTSFQLRFLQFCLLEIIQYNLSVDELSLYCMRVVITLTNKEKTLKQQLSILFQQTLLYTFLLSVSLGIR